VIETPDTKYLPSVSYASKTDFESSGWTQRLSFFNSRDLGIAEATGGQYDFRLVRASGGKPESTGWHYHELNVQISYCLNGYGIVAFEDGRILKVIPGTCVNIPPRFAHNELAFSPDMEMLVLTNPSEVVTVQVDAPDGWDFDEVMSKMDVETAPDRLSEAWMWAS
jgi:quercetin dioxygenase-like cupin family protein